MAKIVQGLSCQKYLQQKSPLDKELCFRKINLTTVCRTDHRKRHLF